MERIRVAWADVVPFALTLEWLAHAALHRNPGLQFHGFDEARVLTRVVEDELLEGGCGCRR